MPQATLSPCLPADFQSLLNAVPPMPLSSPEEVSAVLTAYRIL